MHLELEQFNALIDKKLSAEQRAQWMEHLLECEGCGTRFRALHELHQKTGVQSRRPLPLRYVLGVAAVMVMATTPYLTKKVGTHLPDQTVAQRNHAETFPEGRHLGTLAQIQDVNFTQVAAHWEGRQDILQLIERVDNH